MERITVQEIAGILLKAGWVWSLCRLCRSGFSVAKDPTGECHVSYYDWSEEGTRVKNFDLILNLLQAKGYTLAIGYGESRLTGAEAIQTIRRNGIAVILR